MGLFDRKANGDKSKGGTRKCPCCGVRIEADCLFCTACGADLRTSGEALLQEGEGGGMTICPRCGERIEEGCLFCTSCGTDLRKLKKATPEAFQTGSTGASRRLLKAHGFGLRGQIQH